MTDTVTPDTRTTENPEPRTEAGRRLWDYAHGLTRLDKPMSRDKARDLIREEVLRIEAEAAQGAAPRAEGLEVERLAAAIQTIRDYDDDYDSAEEAEALATEYARLAPQERRD